MANALINSAGEKPFEWYNATPTTQLARFPRKASFRTPRWFAWNAG